MADATVFNSGYGDMGVWLDDTKSSNSIAFGFIIGGMQPPRWFRRLVNETYAYITTDADLRGHNTVNFTDPWGDTGAWLWSTGAMTNDRHVVAGVGNSGDWCVLDGDHIFRIVKQKDFNKRFLVRDFRGT